jgi:D-alanyl-D-alanine carboxypeptidase
MPVPGRIVENNRCIIVAMYALLALGIGIAGLPRTAAGQTQAPSIVIDRATGAVLEQNKPFNRWFPASLTKLMTVYVTMRALAGGEIAPGSPVTVSARAAKEPPSKMGYAPGTSLRVDTALKIVIVKSANDIAIALAESVAGSEPAFVGRMNAEAKRLGMADTQFANPNGLHDPAQFTTVRDMALLARQILMEFPQYAPYFSIPAISDSGKVESSFNLLLERFPGADGMKTGFVCASGYNIVASATRNGRQVIAVVFGTTSQTERAVEGARLLLKGFETTSGPLLETLVRQGPPIPPRSQRQKICSETAASQRVDLMPADMVINSPFLSARVQGNPVPISTGGVDAPASEAALTVSLAPKGRIPVPVRRPDANNARILDAFEASEVRQETNAGPSRIPIPEPRPTQ